MTTLHTVGVQPQQQVVAHQQGQQTITYQTVQAHPQAGGGAVISSYSSSAARQTGYIQVVCGVVSVAIGIAAIILDCALAELGSPIWSGVCFFIVAGILGIASGGNQNSCAIVAHLVMSILASLAAFQMTIILIIAALFETRYCNYYMYMYCSSLYGRIIVDSIGCIFGVVEFVVAIIAAAVCCRGSCGYGTVATQQTVVHHYVPNQGNVTIMTSSPQPYGQGMPVQQGYFQQPGHPQMVQGYSISPPQAYHNPPTIMTPHQASGLNQHPAVPPSYYQMEEKPGTSLPEPQA